MTHTSGYKGYYLESPMVSNFFNGRNDFYGVTKEMVSDKAGNLNMNKASYDFVYSNYGYAVLGLVLESVYETEYTSLLNDFAQNEFFEQIFIFIVFLVFIHRVIHNFNSFFHRKSRIFLVYTDF